MRNKQTEAPCVKRADPEDQALPLTQVEPQRLYRRIADQIAAMIDRGEFTPGARLPAERELARVLGVSRTSVREAIISLEIAGRVDVRVGNGIFVRAVNGRADRSAPDDAGTGPFDLLAARSMIEGEIAAAAAASIRPADLAALRATLAEMREADADGTRRDEADRAFHVAIASATGNAALVHAVSGLWDQRRGELWRRLEGHFHTPDLRQRTIADHAAIIDALAARDAAAAREAMHRHLARVDREFRRSLDPAGAPRPAKREPAPARSTPRARGSARP